MSTKVIRPTVYVASKTYYARLWRNYRELGWNIISTWIDEAEVGQTKDFTDLWSRCVSEASRADILILYHTEGDVLKGALVEVGAALASGKEVWKVGNWAGDSFKHHPKVRSFNNLSDVDSELFSLEIKSTKSPA